MICCHFLMVFVMTANGGDIVLSPGINYKLQKQSKTYDIKAMINLLLKNK